MNSLLLTTSFLTLAAPTFAGTYVVDDDGGPGVDFLDIGSAIAATAPGDILLVRAGNYTSFVLDKAERLIGDGSGVVHVDGTIHQYNVEVHDIANGSVAAISGMTVTSLILSDSPGRIVIDNVISRGSTVAQCADVRWIGCDVSGYGGSANTYTYSGDPAITVDHSRVEVTSSTLRGGNGFDGYQYGDEGGWGSHGVLLLAGAEFHAARTTIVGGNGGNVGGWDLYGYGGNAGHGVVLAGSAAEPASALLSGQPTDTIGGGAPGYGDVSSGSPGTALNISGAHDHVRVSGVTAPHAADPRIEVPIPADPSMSLVGIPTAGQPMTFRISGAPGSHTELLLGRTAQIVPTSGTEEDLLVVPLRTKNLGDIGANGLVSTNILLPSGTPKGQKYFAQARVTYGDGTQHYTNSTPIVVR